MSDNNFFHGMTPEMQNSFNQFLASLLATPGATPLVAAGSIPSARLGFATDASNADTISIGGQTFTFLTTLIAAGATTQVKRGTSAAATRAALVNAINGVTDTNVVSATTPFSEPIVADQVGTLVRIRLADKQGGNPIAGVSPSIALVSALTPGADIWNAANLNVSGRSIPAGGTQIVRDKVTITAAMVSAGSFEVELPFVPSAFSYEVATSTGAMRATTDTITVTSSTITITLAGGASPALQAGDIVNFTASS